MDVAQSFDGIRPGRLAGRAREQRETLRAGFRDSDWGQFGVISLLAATVFVTLASAGSNVLTFDVSIARAVQASDLPGLGAMAAFVTVAGGTAAVFAVGGAVVLCLLRSGRYVATLPVIAALALRCGNAMIKGAADSPRPTAGYLERVETTSGLGFPSAHVMGVVLLYGVIAVLAGDLIRARALRLPIQAVAFGIILIVGPGRIYAGAHWPTDVLGAYLYGVLFLIPVIVAYRTLRDTLPGRLSAPRPAALRRLVALPVTRKP